MKIRNGFVSNSSSSSFVIMKIDDEFIIGDKEFYKDIQNDSYSNTYIIDIDELMETLIDAKNKGKNTIKVEYGTYNY